MALSNDILVLKDLLMTLLARIESLESDNAALQAENTELHSCSNLNHKKLF